MPTIVRVVLGITLFWSILVGFALTVGRGMTSAEIAYVRVGEQDRDIWTLEVERGVVVNLTLSPANETSPSWSPDGHYLAFVSDRSGNEDVYVLDAVGGGLRDVSSHRARDWSPVWSPDSSRLAFVSRRGGSDEIYVVNADGSALLNVSNDSGLDVHPSWSPDGMRLVFESTRCCGFPFYVYDFSTGQVKQIAQANTAGESPSWSPDGEHIFFTMLRPGTDPAFRLYHYADVGVVSSDGQDTVQFFDSGGNDSSLVWSPDGGRFAVASCFPRGCKSIFVVNGDGTHAKEIAPTCPGAGWVDTSSPNWSLDGRQLAFVSSCYGSFDVYVADLDGEHLRRLTEDEAHELSPVWRP